MQTSTTITKYVVFFRENGKEELDFFLYDEVPTCDYYRLEIPIPMEWRGSFKGEISERTNLKLEEPLLDEGV